LEPAYDSRREKVDIDPSDTSSVETSVTDKRYDLRMRYQARLMHLLVGRQQLEPPAAISDQEFTVDELVPDDLVSPQEFIEFRRKRLAVCDGTGSRRRYRLRPSGCSALG
jgi:hypothetical protein